MDQNKPVKKNSTEKLRKVLATTLNLLARWFFMLSLVAAAAFCVFVWYRYIYQANWDDTKKQQYINEQAKFSFDKAGYQKIIDMMNSRKDKLESFPNFTGRDIFYPDGF